MKKFLLIMGVVFAVVSCNNNNEGAATNEDPNKVQPVSEAIPDSMKLVKDSVVVPDSTAGNGAAKMNADTTKKKIADLGQSWFYLA